MHATLHDADPTARVTPPEAAQLLGTTVGVLRIWRQRGRGPAYNLRGGRVLYTVRDLQAFDRGVRIEPINSKSLTDEERAGCVLRHETQARLRGASRQGSLEGPQGVMRDFVRRSAEIDRAFGAPRMRLDGQGQD